MPTAQDDVVSTAAAAAAAVTIHTRLIGVRAEGVAWGCSPQESGKSIFG